MDAALKIPVIDARATGENINRMRKARGLSTAEMQDILGFTNRNAIYKWFRGVNLPTLDNLVILAALFDVNVSDIIVVSKEV
jgi:transcriptional regulator with XRE-family HTH domain